MTDYYAHTPNSAGDWHVLQEHLLAVEARSAEFAGSFGAEGLGRAAGVGHDIGKFNSAFQTYLDACHRASQSGAKPPPSNNPHAIYGAFNAAQLGMPLVALAVLAHHGGLRNRAEAGGRLRAEGAAREAGRDPQPVIATARLLLPETAATETLPRWLADMGNGPDAALATEFLTRMLLSCVVDADRLDTERHTDREASAKRPPHVDPDERWAALWAAFERSRNELDRAALDTQVNRIRRQVLERCIAAAEDEPGFFRLTVPTGGGKTRSSLAFAIRHALRHRLDRIIVAIPYTSIIDQTAAVYRAILGDSAVLEHHSGSEPDEITTEEQSEARVRQRLASENWDAPVIVTTTVQLFESLFSNRTSKCRKIHNIARSVLILDEVQCLPPHLLEPLVSGLQELARHYGVSPVLCTATQPALDEAAGRLPLIGAAREIVPEFAAHFAALRRVRYHVEPEPLDVVALAARIRDRAQCVVVLNTRKDALALLSALGAEGCDPVYHLSTLLCPAHRRDVLERVRARLRPDSDLPCTLITTTVIECGVDLDAPLLYRAIAPLDRIVQAAGRCNREGRRMTPGDVHVFELAGGSAPRGAYRTGIDEATRMLHESGIDLNDPTVFDAYFRRFYGDLSLDERGVQESRQRLNFEDVAAAVRLIADDTESVVVNYDPNRVEPLLARAERGGAPSADVWRRLQPYMVNLYRYDLEAAKRRNDVREVVPGLTVWQGAYDELRGIAAVAPDPADLIC